MTAVARTPWSAEYRSTLRLTSQGAILSSELGIDLQTTDLSALGPARIGNGSNIDSRDALSKGARRATGACANDELRVFGRQLSDRPRMGRRATAALRLVLGAEQRRG